MNIYADQAATTRISETAKKAMLDCMDKAYGNPSSLHTPGQTAKEYLEAARISVAEQIGARPAEIYFTSGGSESDNQAIFSAARLGAMKGKRHIVSTKIEHHAVLHALKRLEKEGFEVTYLDVHGDGIVRPEEVCSAIREDTALVSVMYANNEIGTLQPIREIGRICREKKVLFHTDAVQAAGHVSIDVEQDSVDMLSLSGHKFCGPRGAGALYVKKGVSLLNLIEGGAQERGKRAGTENLPAIVGMAAALEESCRRMDEDGRKVTELRERLIDGLLRIPHSRLNGDRKRRLPGNINVCFEGIEGESLLLLLDARGIAASSGSACTSGSLNPSHVLLALGLPHEVAHGSLRLTIGPDNTAEEIDYMVENIKQVVEYLRNMSPVWEELQKGERRYVIQ